MLRLFGIPYITAPMEAEAQCATLVQLNLVEGIITDDSDVFLFGGMRVFKNMFNQSKTVECFRLADLCHELGLERDKLIQLAYLLGSDYVDGLPGVGPVVAMELLKEFPGNGGLHKFKDWWLRVQSGKDRPEDNKSKFRQRFVRAFAPRIGLTSFQNLRCRKRNSKTCICLMIGPIPPWYVWLCGLRSCMIDHVSRGMHTTAQRLTSLTSLSSGAFLISTGSASKASIPVLYESSTHNALQRLFLEELGWSRSKVEELLLPIIQRMNKRGQVRSLQISHVSILMD